ncbi:restriction endonuclease subunit S [Mycoplasma sp. Z463D]
MNKNELKPSIRFKGFTDAWEKREFGSLFTEYIEKGDFSLKPLSVKQGVGTVVRSQSDFNIQWDINTLLNSKIVHKDDFILHLRSFEGGLEKANSDGLISPAYRTFRGLNINSEFYYICLRSFEFINNQLSSHVYGIRDGKTIDIEGLKSIKLPYTNIEEQKCIADFLVVFSSIITFYKRKSEKLENLKKSLLEKMFVSDGEQFPAIRFKGFTNTWEKIKLGNIVQFYNGESYEAQQLPKGKYELINLNSISIDGGLKESGKFINNPKETLLKDDLVMVLSDVAHGDLLGRVALIPLDYRYVLNQRVALLRVVSTVIPSFLFWNINANQKYFKKSGAGSSQLNISKFNVLDFDICFPSKQEQIIIDSFLKKISSIITFYKRKCDKLENIKKSLLEKMFC